MEEKRKAWDAAGRYLLPKPVRISRIEIENEVTRTFELDGALAAAPGQFVMVWLPDQEEKPFSLAGADPIRLTVAAVGPFSQRLHRRRVGDTVWVRGPLGRGYRPPDPALPPRQVVVVGGGYGVAPLLFLARQLLAGGHDVTAVIGARSQSQLLLVDKFEALTVPVRVATEDGSAGQTGRVTAPLQAIFSGPKPDIVYACGPVGMLLAVAELCQQAGVPAQLGWEAFMRCGIGLCGSCEIGQGWLTCLDGPVFDFNPVGRDPESQS